MINTLTCDCGQSTDYEVLSSQQEVICVHCGQPTLAVHKFESSQPAAKPREYHWPLLPTLPTLPQIFRVYSLTLLMLGISLALGYYEFASVLLIAFIALLPIARIFTWAAINIFREQVALWKFNRSQRV